MQKFILPLIAATLITSCSKKVVLGSIHIERFIDNHEYLTSEISISLNRINSFKQSNGNSLIHLYLDIKNNSDNQKEYNLKDYTFVLENTDYKYETDSLDFFSEYKFKLEPGISKTLGFSSTLPYSYNDEKFYFSTIIEEYEYKLFLYNSNGDLYSGNGIFTK